jgi:hypothetical protein
VTALKAVTSLLLLGGYKQLGMNTAGRPGCPRFGVSRMVSLVAALAAIALLLAGCGGSSSPSSSATPGAATADFAGKVVAFAACMRSHGLPSYPDPQVSESGSHGSIKLSPGSLARTPAFRPASRACGHLLPDGGAPAATSPQAQAQDVEYADCMRSHGVPGFPDPDHDGVFTLPAGIDQQAPLFERATQACMRVQPSSLSINNQPPGGS